MSNLLVQTIKHTNNTTAQTIDTSGRTTAVLNNDTTYRSDNGAVTQNMVQGLAKQWMNFNHSTNSVLDSFNVSGTTDNTTGHFTQNYTNNMNSANYSRTAVAAETSGGPFSDRYCGTARGSSRRNTSNAEFVAGDTSDGMSTGRDQGDWCTAVFGDLA
jgi:hypothetical protein